MLKYIICLLIFFKAITAGAQKNNEHPFLLIKTTEIEKIRESIGLKKWRQKSWLQLKEKADLFLKEKIDIPSRGGNWEHNYVSPVTGNELVRGKQTGNLQWEHFDGITKEKLVSDTSDIKKDYDGVVISLLHDTWAIGALQLGLAYQLSKDRVYADKAKQILLAYASVYPLLPIRDRDNNKGFTMAPTGVGKVHVQDLNEAL